ncbi:MAG: hypothetical protein DIZ80_00550 [endosymbiont of Galathealinum brachiosum]|uniref:histidine kinase n=1 Tax=endosymbiont of Galathealinum brachiosum TaxID=2200906 RepID=A0A370DPC9_9GAMM|nr:MAG: hypothetical protein DIZ80_00550 [endosymbiont of Galathealinum brachiosum]
MLNRIKINPASFITPLFLVLCLSVIRLQYGVLLFHTLAELFSVMVGVLMLVIAWNTRRFTHNDFLVYLGTGYFWVAMLDTWHTFTVNGIPFFNITDSEVTLHFWIYTRLFEALLLLSASIFLKRKLKAKLAFVSGGLLSLVIIWVSFSLTSPVMLTSEGLTAFKIGVEILVIVLLLLAIFIYFSKKELLTPRVLHYLLASLTLTICAELFFTLYTDFHGVPFVIGHLFKFLSFWMIYQAIVQTTLKEPFSIMAQASNSYDAIPHPAIVVDRHGLITQVNNAAEDMANKSAQALFQKPVHRYFHAPNVTEETCELCQAIKDCKTLNNHVVFFPETEKWFIVSLAAIKLGDSIDGMVQSLTDITERKKSEIAFRDSESHMKTLVQTLPDLIWLKDPDGVYLSCNERFELLFGVSESDLIGKTDYDFVDKDIADFFRKHDKAAMSAGEPTINEEELTFSNDGHKELVETIKTPMFSPAGELIGVLGIARDITDRRQAEKSLIRVQKMDAIGQLTGGIAHDFNNLLGVILGNLELLELQIEDHDKAHKRIKSIYESGKRAANLTKQLLGFSRNQASQLSVVKINDVIESMTDMISRSITPEIKIEQHFFDELWKTEIDAGEFKDSVLNLCINARDAITGHGKLIIATENVTLNKEYSEHTPGLNPGKYVKLTVTDNGVGIPENLTERVFEPFFTTKDQGKGTGLGLAMVYGFVKRSNGYIKCNSEEGVGTSFIIYLPKSELKEIPVVENIISKESTPRSHETILVVDDETGLLNLAKDILEMQGYRVLTASDGIKALDILAKEHSIDLLFSDVVMPNGMSGYELAEQATKNNPKLKVLMTSGYTEDVIPNKEQTQFSDTLLRKPYTHAELTGRIRALIDELDEKLEIN